MHRIPAAAEVGNNVDPDEEAIAAAETQAQDKSIRVEMSPIVGRAGWGEKRERELVLADSTQVGEVRSGRQGDVATAPYRSKARQNIRQM